MRRQREAAGTFPGVSGSSSLPGTLRNVGLTRSGATVTPYRLSASGRSQRLFWCGTRGMGATVIVLNSGLTGGIPTRACPPRGRACGAPPWSEGVLRCDRFSRSAPLLLTLLTALDTSPCRSPVLGRNTLNHLVDTIPCQPHHQRAPRQRVISRSWSRGDGVRAPSLSVFASSAAAPGTSSPLVLRVGGRKRFVHGLGSAHSRGGAAGVGQCCGESRDQDVEAAFEFRGAVVRRQDGCEAAQEGEVSDRQPVQAQAQ